MKFNLKSFLSAGFLLCGIQAFAAVEFLEMESKIIEGEDEIFLDHFTSGSSSDIEITQIRSDFKIPGSRAHDADGKIRHRTGVRESLSGRVHPAHRAPAAR